MAAPLSSEVTINISLSGAGITRAGFGVDLILSNTGNAWATPELTRTYPTAAALLADFPASTPEGAAGQALFAQPLKPTSVLVGRGTHKPTEVKTLGSITSINNTAYLVNVVSTDVASTPNVGESWSAKFTTDGTATIKKIVDGLVALLTPAAWIALHAYVVGNRATNDTGKAYECTVAGTSAAAVGPTTKTPVVDGTVTWKYIATPNFTAVNTGDVTVTCTGNAAGNWFALEPIASSDPAAVSNLMLLTDTTADPGVATDLAAIFNANQAWYALTLLFKSDAILNTPSTGAATWCQANGRLLLVSCSDTACATTASTGEDVLAELGELAGSYVAGMWHPRDAEWFDAAKAGYFLPLSPGSDNWRLKSYAGVSPVNLTATQEANLIARRAAFYETLGSLPLDTGLGQVEDGTTFLWIDTRRNIDWYATNLQADLINLLVVNNKLAHTNAGLQTIRAAIAARNDLGIIAGVISPDPLDAANGINEPYTVTVPLSTDAGTFDATLRAQSGISTRWKLSSGINSITVNVNVTQ